MNNDLTYKIYRDFSEKLKEDWLDLENKGDFYFFQKYEYINNLIKSFNINSYIIIVIYSENAPIAIFPLELKIFKKIKILQWLGADQSDYCCPLIDKKKLLNKLNFQFIWKKILGDIKNLDIIFLSKQPEFINNVLNPFVQYLQNNYFSKVYLVKLTNSDIDYLSLIENKKFISEFKRTKKKLLENNTIKFSSVVGLRANNLISNIMFKKISSLEKRGLSHFINENFISFYKNLITLYPNKVIVSTLEINNEIIAANIGIMENKRFYYFLPVVFSEKFKSFSPGKLLIYELINWSNKQEVEIFDFGLGEENYKKYWSNYSIRMFRHLSYKGLKGFIIFHLLKVYLKIKFMIRKP